MSTKRATSSLHAVQVADHLSTLASLLVCATCKVPLRARALVFGGDRSVCPECADAMQTSVSAAVLRDTSECVARFKLAVKNMLVQVEEYRKRGLMEVQLLGLAREKALEVQTDLLDVSAGQLRACVALGRAAVVSGDDGPICEAARTAKAMEGLMAVPTRLCTGTRLAVLCDLSSGLTCLEGATRLQHFEVDAARSSVAGNGLASYANDGVARNVIRMTCMDSDGELAGWATLEDADVGMTVNGAAWQVASAVFTDPGVLEVTYVVDEGLEEMEVGVSLCGVAVPGGPWRPHAGFMAKGVLIATLPLRHVSHDSGLGVSSNGSLMVVHNSSTNQLDVYRTEDGSHVRAFGGHGTGLGEFRYPPGFCMTPHDTVLVAEWSNKRIQEVTLEGVHVKFIFVGDGPLKMAVHGDVIAVTTFDNSIMLYSHTTGASVGEISDVFDKMSQSMCFSPGGEHLLAAGFSGFMTLASVHGQPARHIGPRGPWVTVAFTCTGDVMGVDTYGVKSVYSATDGMLLRSWEAANRENLTCSFVCVVSGNRLYVLEHGRVQVYE